MSIRSRDRHGFCAGLLAVLGIVFGLLAAGADARGQAGAGEVLYAKQCGYCHGLAGEGTLEEYPHALAGTRPLESLTKYVAKTMPADNPESLSEEEAASVSAYIHEAFYSKEAQERNTPRLELSRLTVRQYQNAATDLLGSFRGSGKWDDERGLKGEYYKSRRFRSNDRVLERRDAVVSFDWGIETPDNEKIDPKEFSAQWTGSIRAPETGEFEFVVRTEHATRLYVNDSRTPIIDAWVKSGDDKEFRGSARLMAGRVYPIKLEFSKATQGVQEERFKDKVPMQPASISLSWKPPHRAQELVPAHCLSPHEWPETFVVTTPFPPDDRSMGYERGTTISEAWEQATTDGAIEVAAYVLANLRELAQVRENASDREQKLREFSTKFVERAFRRPLTADQQAIYVDATLQSAPDLDTGVKRVVLLAMKSPRFLYREIGGTNDGYDTASRLSFAMWDSIPNEELLKAAAEGKLVSRDEIKEQAGRMVGDLRTKSKMREFLMQWLKVDQIPELAKDPAIFPEFDETLASDLRTSLDLFLDDAVWKSEGSDYRRLMVSDELFLNQRLATEYGTEVAADAGFQKVKVEKGERAGVLTHPYLMSYFAYTGTSSPIHRGVFLARNVLGRALRPPPIAVAPLAPDLHEGLTTRERVQLQTSPEACMACHGLINSLGFTLENFDPLGRYREQEKGKAVDSSGWYVDRLEEERQFTGVKDLAQYVAESEEAQGTFVEQLFHFMVKQPIRAYGFETPTTLKEKFASEECNIQRLIVEIAIQAALGPLKPSA